MIKIQITLENVDFNGLIDLFLPALTEKLKQEKGPLTRLLSGAIPPSVIKAVFESLPEEKKERMAAELINSNAVVISERIKEFARRQNVEFTVTSLEAQT